MTSYEQYVEVANFVKTEFLMTPVYMLGEAIKIEPPYVVVRVFGIANESCGDVRQDIKGYNIFCYGENGGRAEKLISDVLGVFTGASTPSRLELVNLESVGMIERLEDDLFEGVVSFQVSSIFSK